MAVQRGRSKRRGESYSFPYGEPLSVERTKLEDFFNILLGCSVIPWPWLKGDSHLPSAGANNSLERAQFIAVIVRVLTATDRRGRGPSTLGNLSLRESRLLA